MISAREGSVCKSNELCHKTKLYYIRHTLLYVTQIIFYYILLICSHEETF